MFSDPQKKMMFVSIWTSFAISLWILNREKKRFTVPVIQDFKPWKAAVLMLTGFIGGKLSRIPGLQPSGLVKNIRSPRNNFNFSTET